MMSSDHAHDRVNKKWKNSYVSVYLFNLYFFLDMLFYFQFSLNWISNFLKAD